MLISAYILILLYGTLITSFTIGWLRLSRRKIPPKTSKFVSVIVAARNEEANIRSLISSLKQQSYPINSFEVIIIDDNSEDKTLELLEHLCLDNMTVLPSPSHQSGKKQAIALGIKHAKSSTILVTDADCNHHPQWLENMIAFHQDTDSKLTFGPVDFKTSNSLWEKLQAVEFISLVASGAGSAGIGSPMFCNAANMMFEKEEYTNANLKEELASGDDVFLLHSLKKQNKKTSFNASPEAKVYTKPQDSICAFFHQRVRWASKSTNYTDWLSIFTSFLVFIYCCFMIISAGSLNLQETLLVWLGKFCIDFIFFSITLPFFKKGNLLIYTPFIALIYPIYVIIVGFASIKGTYKWKGRKH